MPGTGHRWQLGTFIKCNKTIKHVDVNGPKMQHIKQNTKRQKTKQKTEKKDKKKKQKCTLKSVKQNKQFWSKNPKKTNVNAVGCEAGKIVREGDKNGEH